MTFENLHQAGADFEKWFRVLEGTFENLHQADADFEKSLSFWEAVFKICVRQMQILKSQMQFSKVGFAMAQYFWAGSDEPAS